METTLTIDEDILAVAQSRAESTGESIGKVISDMARGFLTIQRESPEFEPTLGYRLLPVSPNARPVTMEEVNRLRDEAE
jgi:hypothetical protein